ncbi:M24 family metallopeptidase [Fluviispira multicolorata]|uniref:M24 family metallopeptidase n=1 Tax=Fluviispira multicolorata TaxID=2654512 RepID=A0A833JAD2_9BACT|nr:M24 family metallopeptidase [Fluviispira multicolorata]KAB8027754.1 M24 family metallopeptidase [Fluviispira multicolorata]
MILNQQEAENINSNAIVSMATQARNKTWDAVHEIKNRIRPGMTELEAIKIANRYFADCGVRRFWHQTHIRFGESTILSFNDTYRENIILKENDIFYIDVGPVWDGIEGDCGNTFVMGEGSKFLQIKNDIKVLFDDVHQYWLKTQATGQKLCEYSRQQVEKMGYLLLPEYVKGHRLSEFSHSKYTNAGLFDLDFCPSAERWILELQICHPSMKFGAFYEDLLL